MGTGKYNTFFYQMQEPEKKSQALLLVKYFSCECPGPDSNRHEVTLGRF
jgi:hypothetical protein